MRKWIVLAFALAGCDKLFNLKELPPVDGDARGPADADSLRVDGSDGSAPDAGPCVSNGHDEDGDGVDDPCDRCPTVNNTMTDTDGDGLPDDCDPDLGTNKKDKILLAATFGGMYGLSAFDPGVGTTYIAAGTGSIDVKGNALNNARGQLYTSSMYLPTKVEVLVGGIESNSMVSEAVVDVGSSGCHVYYGCNTSNTCVVMQPGTNSPSALGGPPTAVKSLVVMNKATAIECVASTLGTVTAPGSGAFTLSRIGITVGIGGTAHVESIVIYGSKN